MRRRATRRGHSPGACRQLTAGKRRRPQATGQVALRVLVTGVSGFIGGALARALASRGDSVLGASRRALTGTNGSDHIVVDLGAPGAAFAQVQPADVVVHCAGLAAPAAALADPVAAFATNAVGTSNV